MTKTKDSAPSSANLLKGRNILTVGLAAGAILIGGNVVMRVIGNDKAAAGPTKTELIRQGVIRLEEYQTKHHNIISVAPDTRHPGLEQVTYQFSPGHNNISFLAAEVAPDQVRDHAYADADSYNDGSEVVSYGRPLTVDVDPATGFIVPNPNLPSAENTG